MTVRLGRGESLMSLSCRDRINVQPLFIILIITLPSLDFYKADTIILPNSIFLYKLYIWLK